MVRGSSATEQINRVPSGKAFINEKPLRKVKKAKKMIVALEKKLLF
jgi:hypothetical protein